MLRSRLIKRLSITVIVIFWLIMMGLLIRRELLVSRIPGSDDTSATPATPTDSWMGVYLPGDARVGFVNVRTTPGERRLPADPSSLERGTNVEMTVQMALTLFGRTTKMVVLGSAWIADEHGLRDFELRVRSGGADTRIEGRVTRPPDSETDVLEARVHTAGEAFPVRIPFNANAALWEGGALSSLDVADLEIGQECVIDTLDPMSFSVTKAHIKCVGEETLEFAGEPVRTKVVTVTVSSMVSKAWVMEDGEVLRMDMPIGLSLRKITAQEALESVTGADSSSLLEITAIKPTGMRPFREARRMVFRVAGLETHTRLPQDDTQTRRGDRVYVVECPAVPDNGGPPPSALADREDLVEYLEDSALVQSSHPRIREQGLAILGDATGLWPAAERFYDWVYVNIEKEAVASIPSALEVLANKEGDCNEHTVLFAALARSAGLPTRIALGVVWSEEYEGFYYHAWPEVYWEPAPEQDGESGAVDRADRPGSTGRWIWMDPTLGQPIADATHIKLLTGDIEQWPQLLHFIGQLQLEILEIE